MPNFVVERYRSRADPDSLADVAARLTAGARHVSPEGSSVRYVDTIFLPDDETCLHLFEADTEAEVRAVTRQAGIDADRIVPAEQVERGEVGWTTDGSEEGER